MSNSGQSSAAADTEDDEKNGDSNSKEDQKRNAEDSPSSSSSDGRSQHSEQQEDSENLDERRQRRATTPDITRSDASSSDDDEEDTNNAKRQSVSDGTERSSPARSTPGPNRTPGPRQSGFSSRVGLLAACRSVDLYERLNRIDEGTYGVVYRAKNKETGEIVALKKVKMEKEKEGFPVTSLREINILLSLDHPNIVSVKEIVVGKNLDSIFMVMEYVDNELKSVMEYMRQPFSQSEVKCLLLQLLTGIELLHDNWIIHRDLKTSNLLLNNKGILKICDFGLARQYGSPLKPYTHMVVTLWYRAPELLLGAKTYSTAIDMWSVGCIFAELLSKEPLFPGKSEIDQLDKIFKMLGSPNEKVWPGFSEFPSAKKIKFANQPYNNLRQKFPVTSFAGKPYLTENGLDLLNGLLTYDPNNRITASEALRHAYFQESPPPKDPDLMPTYPSIHEDIRRKRKSDSDEAIKLERELREQLLEKEKDDDRAYTYRDRTYAAKVHRK